MFIGRESEIARILEFLNDGKSRAGMLFGKRRIGKTTLLEEAARRYKGKAVFFECGKVSKSRNMEMLASALSSSFGLDFSSMGLDAMFTVLGSMKEDILVIMDEYQYFRKNDCDYEMDSELKRVIDHLGGNIRILLCGSSISIMRSLLMHENPLYGRLDLVMELGEMDYHDAAKFYPDIPISNRIEFYSVFGGSPYVLSAIDASRSLEENIERLILQPTGILRTYIEYIFFIELEGVPYLQSVLDALGNSKLRYSEIESRIGMKSTGLLAKYLDTMIGMDIIECISPINKRDDRKKRFYSIKDNLLRFYYSYVFQKKGELSLIGEKQFYEKHIAKSIDTFISYRFERIAWQYFSRQARLGKRELEDIGSYWFDDRNSHSNGEFDCVIRNNGSFECFEVKFLKNPMPSSQVIEEAEKIRAIQGVEISRIGMVSSSGFEGSRLEGIEYITGQDLYR